MEIDSGVNSLTIAVCIAFALTIATIIKVGSARLILALMIFVVSVAPPFTDDGFPIRTWLFALQENRSEIYVVLAMGLLVGVLSHLRSAPLRGAGPQAALLLLIGLYQGALRMHHEDISSGVATMGFAVSTVGALALGLPVLLDRPRSWLLVLQAILAANVLWLGAVIVQALVEPQQLILNGRFAGITSNPQSAAIVLSLGSVLALWMAMHDPRRWHQGPWLLLFAAELSLLVWTGSRTGVLAFLLGTMVILRRRMGPKLLLIGSGVGLAYFLSSWMGGWGLEDAATRLASVHDSGRQDALARMVATGLAHPIFGDGISDAGASENSYLLAFAAFGMGMVMLVILLLAVSVRECIRVSREATKDPGLRGFADVIVAFNAMYFTIAMFEGIIMARVREALVWMIAFSALSMAVRRASLSRGRDRHRQLRMRARRQATVNAQKRPRVQLAVHPLGRAHVGAMGAARQLR
jgi:hypothetical protein